MFSSHAVLEIAPKTTIEIKRIDETHVEIRVTTMGDDAKDHHVDVETLSITLDEMCDRLVAVGDLLAGIKDK